MKTNCEFRTYLTDATDLSGMTKVPSVTGPTGTTKVTGTTNIHCNLLCDREGASNCCAILMLRFIAERCSDPTALIEDARKVLEKYPVR